VLPEPAVEIVRRARVCTARIYNQPRLHSTLGDRPLLPAAFEAPHRATHHATMRITADPPVQKRTHMNLA
jgi:hypothetical protein